MADMTVFEFMETVRDLPQVATIDRTNNSRYPFWLLVRHYRQLTGKKPKCFVFSKNEANGLKGAMEEYSLLGQDFYVLEGYREDFIRRINLPKGVYCVAETDDGTLSIPPYTQKTKKDILKTLIRQLDLNMGIRDLSSLDWTTCRDYPDFEIILRRAKILKWSEENIEEELNRLSYGHVLVDMKKANYKSVVSLVDRYGPLWMWSYLTGLVVDLIQLKSLKLMGYEDERITREMDLSRGRSTELFESHKTLTREEIISLGAKLFKYDLLFQRDKNLAMNLVLFSGITAVARK